MPYLGFSAKNDITINATSDLELTSDNTTIKFGADDDVTITHDPDDGLIFKSIATADDNPFLLTIQTGETDLAANDVIGKIQFQAPDEGTGTDANLVSAAIQAVAEGDFSSSSNATSLQFMTGSSEAAATKMTILSSGNVGIGTTSPSSNLAIETSSIASLSSYAGHIVIGPSTRSSSSGDYSGGILFDQANGVQASGKKGASILGFQDGSDVNSMGITFNVHGTDGSANRFEAMRIDSSGKVGIGNSSPSYLLSLSSASTTQAEIKTTATNGTAQIRFTNDARTYTLGIDNNDTFFLYDATGTSSRFVVNSSGNFGIGTTSPSFPLSVEVDNSTWVSRIYNTGSDADASALLVRTDATAAHDALALGVYADSGYKMVVRSTGNVGIGTTSPARSPLHLNVSSGDATIHMTNSSTGTSSSDGLSVFAGASLAGLWYRESGSLQFATNSTERLRIDSNGRVGIAKTPDSSLGSFLQIEGNDGIAVGRSGQSNHFIIRPNASTDGLRFTQAGTGDRVTIDSSGNVLVGTTSLTTGTLGSSNTFLELSAGTNNGSGTLILSRNTTTDDNEVGGVRFANQNNADDDGLDADGKLIAAISARLQTSDSNAGDDSGGHLVFYTKPEAGNYAERMRINSNGQVGIGTGDSVGDLLHIAATDPAIRFEDTSSGISGHSRIFTDNNNAITLDADTDSDRGSSSIMFKVDGTEHARIDSSGNLLLGTTSTTLYDATSGGGILAVPNSSTTIARQSTGSTQPLLILNETGVDGTLQQFRKDGSTVGSIASGPFSISASGVNNTGWSFGDNSAIEPMKNSATSDNLVDLGSSSKRMDDIHATNGTIQTSDKNEKNTIVDSDLGLDFIKRLSPKSYKFNNKTRTHYGLIAQDVETVLSDISKSSTDFAGFIKDDISEDKDGSHYRYGLRYTELIAPMIKALQEANAKIETLEIEVAKLKGE